MLLALICIWLLGVMIGGSSAGIAAIKSVGMMAGWQGSGARDARSASHTAPTEHDMADAVEWCEACWGMQTVEPDPGTVTRPWCRACGGTGTCSWAKPESQQRKETCDAPLN